MLLYEKYIIIIPKIIFLKITNNKNNKLEKIINNKQ